MDPASCLPLELLHKIFRHYLSDRRFPVASFDHSDGLWVLGQVNSAWRDATFSDPSFWSTITATFSYHDQFMRNMIEGVPTVLFSDRIVQSLAYILCRSGDIPLSVYLRFYIHNPDDATFPTWRNFFFLLTAQSSRFRSLDILLPTEIWDYFSGTRPDPLPWPNEPHDTFDTDWIVPVVSIESMRRKIHANYVACTATEMPQLRHLTAHESFLDSVTASSLKSLKAMEEFSTRTSADIPSLVGFLHRSQCALTDLSIKWRGSHDELVIILSGLPMLEALSLRSGFDISFYMRMKLPSSILPRLRAFSHWVYIPPAFSIAPDADVAAIIDMVESRLAGGMLKSVDIETMKQAINKDLRKRLASINALPNVKVRIGGIFS
ncbi:uncharacterized protein EV420DRAFT_1180934 [Desarmillaria tabescens]|uniref:F-box domain-containing protein n=1 Tax=Armillaria tabescens TaxID=1929756 RepID=A0AA39TPV8_ARMTA|nr:uncharacterized protein EV420DRAFT_1180934 [Desarmillaria tabescens]KAK0462298.1 hypothetical protein EV420DRAFT_1180934 [Desarmillaria tabescens]